MKRDILTLLIIILINAFSCGAQKEYVYNNNGRKETITALELKEVVFSELIKNIKQLNSQLPIQIDELTEMHSAILNGSTINYNYIAYIDSSELSDEDIESFCNETKKIQKYNLRFLFKQNSDKMPVSEWIRLYKELGIKYNYNYFDANRKVWARIVVDFEDF